MIATRKILIDCCQLAVSHSSAMGLALLAISLFNTAARAHSEQEAPALVDIYPQRAFLTVRISGNGGDLADLIQADAHGSASDQASEVTPKSQKAAREYFARHLTFKQGGQRLPGELKLLRLWHDDALDLSRTRFEALYRFERDPKLSSEPLHVTNTLFDYLEKSRVVVSLRGVEKTLSDGETATFAAALATSTLSQNALDWSINGFLALPEWHVLIFALALFLAATNLLPRVIFGALAAFTLAQSLSFCAAIAGWFHMPVTLVGVGIGASVLALGIFNVLIAHRAKAREEAFKKNAGAMLIGLCAAFGLAFGLTFAPPLVERGLPEESLAFCLVAFIVGSVVFQVFAALAMMRVLVALRAKFEHNAQYGGMNWDKIVKFASWFVVAAGGYGMIVRLATNLGM